MSASWWETQDCLAEVSMTKWCPFCLFFSFFFFFCKEENDFFSFLHRQNWSMVSASKRRFALLAQVAPACIPFPIDLTVVQTGFYFILFFVQSNHTQWNANVQIDISVRAVLTPGQVLGCCWIMGTNISTKCIRSRGEISSAALRRSLWSVFGSWCVCRKNEGNYEPSSVWKRRFDRLALVEPGWKVQLLALFFGEES